MNYYDILLAKKLSDGGGGDITTEALNVTANGEYTAPTGKAYTPVNVDVPLPSNAYLLKELSNLPQPIASFSDGADAVMQSLKVDIEPVQSGSGDPSPENVRPISGWTEENIIVIDDDVNKNYFYGLSKGLYGVVDLGSLSWTYSGGFFRTLSIPNFKSISQYTTPNAISSIYTAKSWNSIKNTDNMCFAIPANASGQVIFVNTDYTDTTTFKRAMQGVHLIYELAKPTAPTITDTLLNALFEEFDANGYATTIPFTDSQGNPIEVYGGSLDVTSGVLTVTHAVEDMGNMTWNYTSGMFNTTYYATNPPYEVVKPSSNASIADIESELFKKNSYNGLANYQIAMSTAGNIFIKDSDYSDGASFKTAMTGKKIMVKLATPITIQLNPTSIKSLDGENNVFASTGDVEELKYFSK